MENIEKLAQEFATRYHGSIDQRRKYTGEPYIVHPAAVVEIVRRVPHSKEMLCAAWMHDVVEDTPATIDEVRSIFGDDIANLVEMLTDVSKPEDGNRKIRKSIDSIHTSKASPEAKTIKLADLIDNSKSIIQYGKGFAKIWIKENLQLLEVLRGGNGTLWKIAHDTMGFKD